VLSIFRLAAIIFSFFVTEFAMASSTLNLTPAVYDYYRAHAGREPAILAELRDATAKLGGDAVMQIAPEQGAFMALMVKLTGAQRVVEFGCFTGYSSLAMALAGAREITTLDVSEKFTAIARTFWAKAGVADRVTLRLDGGENGIAELLKAGKAGTFDLAFIDADKENYDRYYEGALKLLRAGGLVMIDNVLWGGDVADPAKNDADTAALKALNKKVLADSRVEIAMLPLGDGLTLARKL